MTFNKTILALLSLIILGVSAASAQPIRDIPRPKKLAYADEKFVGGDQYSALEIYEEIYEEDKKKNETDMNVLQRISSLNLMLRDYGKAERWYSRLVRADKDGQFPLARFEYARILKMNKKFDEAIAEYNTFISGYNGANSDQYKKLAANDLKGIELAKKWADAKTEEVIIESMGRNVNTPSQEGSPIALGSDEVVFASMGADSIITVKEGETPSKYYRIYKSRKSDKGWAESAALGKEVNKPGFNTFAPAFSEDKSIMYYTRGVLDGNAPKSFRLFKSTYAGGSFSEGEQLNINSADYSLKHPAIGKMNGKEALFFSSDMPGGQGGWDIWYSLKEADGSFSTPLNLGDAVNTFGDEQTPFFSNGNLYFSSDAHPGIGGFDIFVAEPNSAGKYTQVENMGPAFNSNVDDIYFTVAENPCYAYLTSNRAGTISLKSETCCDDNWVLNTPERCPVDLKVTTFDVRDNKALAGTKVQLIDAATNKVIDEQTNTAGNNFVFTLARNKSYKLVATKLGYNEGKGNSATMDLPKDRPSSLETKLFLDPSATLKVLTYDLQTKQPLTGVKVDLVDAAGKVVATQTTNPGNETVFNMTAGQKVTVKGSKGDLKPDQTEYTAELNKAGEVKLYLGGLPLLTTIHYDFDKFDIRQPDASATLDNNIAILKAFPDLVIKVVSHTDAKGSNEYNDKLSNNRTKSSIEYLTKAGVGAERLLPSYKGEVEPAAPNAKENGADDPVGRQVNRRTEFIIDRGVGAGTKSVDPLLTPAPGQVPVKIDASGGGKTSTPAPVKIEEVKGSAPAPAGGKKNTEYRNPKEG